MIPGSSLRRALAIALALHAAALVLLWVLWEPTDRSHVELVDIEMAPPPPPVEALPEEVAKLPEEPAARDEAEAKDQASTTPPQEPPGEGYAVDAGVDAPIDAPIDAPPDARPRPDAAPDAAEPMIALDQDAGLDGAPDDATQVATLDDAGAGDPSDAGELVALGDAGTGDATQVAVGEGSGEGSGSGSGSSAGSGEGSGALATEEGSGSGKPGATNEPGVAGAPTTAGTAANLLAYFPKGHVVTALVRFDRLRGTEWADKAERLFRPMPDYRVLFGTKDAKVAEKLETLVISTPSPRDAAATTLVGRTRLQRAALRDLLGGSSPVAWSPAKGGLYGKRTGRVFPGDRRVFLSPFRGWFLLAQPQDLPGLTVPAKGDLDAIEASVKLPPWLANIRTIEAESGEDRGPALVVTLGTGGGRVELGDMNFGLGVPSFPMPDRVSLAMELVKQGWLVRGNIRFGTEADADEFVKLATSAQQAAVANPLLKVALGAAAMRVIKNLSFARTGPRISYATSVSIADARAILSFAAQQLDAYFAAIGAGRGP